MGKAVNLTRVVDADGGLGYQAGRGGAVTQATSKGTSVTLNKPTGQITMNGAALAAGVLVEFEVVNSYAAASDTVVLTLSGGVTSFNSYRVWPGVSPSGGRFYVELENRTGGSLSEAIKINFSIIKGATA